MSALSQTSVAPTVPGSDHHTLSLALSSSLPPTVDFATSPISNRPGMTTITLLPPPTSPYNFRPWPIAIGGWGIGNDLDVAFGGPRRRPIAVRFDNCDIRIADKSGQPVVDDSGMVVSDSFWSAVGENVTIEGIVKALIASMCQESSSCPPGASTEAAKFTLEKHNVEEKFRALRPTDELIAPSAVLLDSHLDPTLSTFLSSLSTTPPSSLPSFISSPSPLVYTFPLFPPSHCASLLSTIDAFEATDLPKRRPNTMNNYGIILNEVGMRDYCTSLMAKVVSPLSNFLFKDEIFSHSLDHHHTFCVEYRARELGVGDRHLDMHHDASEVTLNVCLGREGFKASGLQFCGDYGASDHRASSLKLEHTIGTAVLHLGRRRHGADNISGGERVNLIMWARSSAFRAAAAYGHVPLDGYPKAQEGKLVDRVCLSKANDADYENRVKLFGGVIPEDKKKRKYVPFNAPPKSCERIKKNVVKF